MTLHYNKLYAIILVVLAALDGLLGLATGNYLNLLIGALLLFIAVSAFTRPYLTIEPDRVVVHALLGPLKRTFPYSSPQQVKVEGNLMFVESAGQKKRVPVSTWIADATDWAAIRNKFQ